MTNMSFFVYCTDIFEVLWARQTSHYDKLQPILSMHSCILVEHSVCDIVNTHDDFYDEDARSIFLFCTVEYTILFPRTLDVYDAVRIDR